MKVRWTEESLRIRITPAELASLRDGRALGARLGGGGGWAVELVPGGDRLEVSWAGATAHVTLSSGDVERLAHPDTEGVYHHEPALRLLVEKDFPCRHPHALEAREPETERFAPPAAFVARKEHGG